MEDESLFKVKGQEIRKDRETYVQIRRKFLFQNIGVALNNMRSAMLSLQWQAKKLL